MEFLVELWLPILLATVAVFLAGNVVHMLLSYHTKDYTPLPDEDAIRNAINVQKLPRAMYAMSKEARESEEVRQKIKDGPVGLLTIGRNSLSMKRQLIQHFFIAWP